MSEEKTSNDLEWSKRLGRPGRLSERGRYITIPLAIAGLIVLEWQWYWWLVTGVFHTFYYGLGMSVGNHRYWCHKSFKTNKFWEYTMLFAAAVGGFGSTLGFLMTHMEHHRYADTEKDPHAPDYLGKQIWNFLSIKNTGRLKDAVVVLRGKRMWFYDYKIFMMVGWIGLLTSIDLRLLLFGWLIPVSITYYTAVLQILAVHKWGYRNFDVKDKSTNVWWLLPLSLGEGWHNNHHKYAKRASNRIKWWEIDPSYWIIQLIRTDRARS